MSAAGECQRAKDRWTSERAGRRQGAQRASASDGGGRRAEVSIITEGLEAARRRAIAERRQRSVYISEAARRRVGMRRINASEATHPGRPGGVHE